MLESRNTRAVSPRSTSRCARLPRLATLAGDRFRFRRTYRPVRGGSASLLALACAMALCGCGLGAGRTPGAVRLTVTSGFGAEVLHAAPHPKISGQDTVLSLLLRNYSVRTRYGGAFVQGIGGLDGGESGGRPQLVLLRQRGRGSEGGRGDRRPRGRSHLVGPARLERHRGRAGGGRLLPGAVPRRHRRQAHACPRRMLARGRRACQTVQRNCAKAGVPAAIGRSEPAAGPQLLRVLVGPWRELRAERQLQTIEQGPRESGVYATPDAEGTTLTLLDKDGRPVRKLAAGAGLIAATAGQERVPIWAVTGTDARGVALAAGA